MDRQLDSAPRADGFDALPLRALADALHPVCTNPLDPARTPGEQQRGSRAASRAGDAGIDDYAFTLPFSLTGQPVVGLPAAWSAD